MAVGFYDYDIILKPKKLYLNLEAMKIASYYNRKGVNIVLTDKLGDYSKFDEFYICKNIIPQKYREASLKTVQSPNVKYLGLAFSGGAYLPMEPEFEKQIAFPQLYAPYFNKSLHDYGLTIPSLERLLNSQFIRLKMGDNLLDITKLEREQRMYIYDYEIEEVPDWEDRLIYIEKNLTTQNQKIKPIILQNKFKFTSFENITKISKIRGIMSRDIDLVHDETYNEFKYHFDTIKDWVSPRDGVNQIFGSNINPNNSFEVLRELCLSLNKYYYVLSNHKAWHFVVSPNCDTSILNKIQKDFQYWTEVRVDVPFAEYLKQRNAKEYDKMMDIITRNPYGRTFKELIVFPKSDIKRRGWYYHV